MSSRALWGLSIPSALLAWAGIVYFTGTLPPSPLAYALILPLLGLAVTMTLAPGVWLLARGLRLRGTGKRPALALRAATWLGLWSAICVGFQLHGVFSWVPALTLIVVLVLLETFLLQGSKHRR
jgi:hypothetical protein